MGQAILSNGWAKELCGALDLNPNEVRRVILDVQVGCAIKVYVEKYGTKKLLDLKLPEPTAMEVVILDKDSSGEAEILNGTNTKTET